MNNFILVNEIAKDTPITVTLHGAQRAGRMADNYSSGLTRLVTVGGEQIAVSIANIHYAVIGTTEKRVLVTERQEEELRKNGEKPTFVFGSESRF